MKRITKLDDCRIETFDLSQEQHDIAVEMVKKNQRKNGNYTLKEIEDREMVNVWIADHFSVNNEEYAHFLQRALANDAELYTLTYYLGDFPQPISEVAVYDC